MKRIAKSARFLLVLIGAMYVLGAILHAQGINWPFRVGTYSQLRASINSATVPVTVITSQQGSTGFMSTWCITASNACTKPIDCFAYTAASAPTAVPTASALQEIDPGKTFCDQTSFFDPRGVYYRFGVGSGWACVFEASGATCNADGIWR